MKTRMFVLGAAMGAALWMTPPVVAADDKKAEGPNVSVTGCLAQGYEKNEYALKDASGKTYGLKAGSEINLKAHLGHKVTITGAPMKSKEKVKAGKTDESEHLRVSNLSMVSATCS